ncbi:MAG: glutathionylspermidine synthase family protein [Acidobacteria bacterium]|nr:glutathionylspermidine synthase family protein [Acidobacteriota bacterium]MBI3655910.1 glutathionylspermidine synthase family protein [Acidobacteriota bacterium]
MLLSELVTSLSTDYFKWDCYINGRCCVSATPVFLRRQDYEELVSLARQFDRLIKKTIQMVMENTALRRPFGFSRVEQQALDSDRGRPSRYVSLVARYDFCQTYKGQWKAAEFNTDVPGGHPEAVGLNQLLGREFPEHYNPDHLLAALQQALVGDSLDKTVAVLYATGFSEDLQVAQLIRNYLTKRGIRTLLGSPINLQRRGNHAELFGERIDVIYRYYPADWLSALAYRPRQEFLRICSDLTTQVNPFAQIICQNKKISAFWWKQQNLFSRREQDLIQKHVPRTIGFRRDRQHEYKSRQAELVLKRAHGRMGEQVLLGDCATPEEWAQALADIAAYEPEQWTVQEYFHTRPVLHEDKKMYPCYGVYVIGGEVAGLYTRLSPTPRTAYDALNVATLVV